MSSQHPKALLYLSLTEVWERFGFYVVQGLLVLYITRFYGFPDDQAFTISGIFAGLVYISPFLGGLLADRLLGFKSTVIWGGCFLLLGYALLALSANPLFFYPALGTIIVGTGLLKPNISSLLGSQYGFHDPHRDSGFTLFYIGINIGVFLSGFSGYIREAFGWQTAFACASLGMLIGLLTFFSGLKHIKDKQGIAPVSNQVKALLLIGCLAVIALVSFLFQLSALTNYLLPCAGIVLLLFLMVLTLRQTPEDKIRMTLLLILTLASIVFWMLFYQMFNSASLYIDRLVDKNFMGIELNTTIFYASESIFIILFGPLFAWLWQVLGRRQQNPSALSKFILSIFLTGTGFLALSLSANLPNSAGLINPLWIFLAYMLLTIGELLLSPIGLSAVTKLAPQHLSGMMMGVWFVSLGFGGLFAGWIAKLSSVPDPATPVAEKLAIYHSAFMIYAEIAFLIAFALIIVRWLMKVAARKTRLDQAVQV